jgi:hypothetical protein
MAKINKEVKALNRIINSVSSSLLPGLQGDIKSLRKILNQKRPGAFWNDPDKKKQVQVNMKKAHALRPKSRMKLTWRSTGSYVELEDYIKIGELCGCAAHTVRCKLSAGKGVANFSFNNEIITVERI